MMHNGVTSLVHHNPEAVIGNSTAPDLTSADLSAQLGGVSSRGGMNIEFFYNRIRYGDSNGALAGKMETRLYVALQPKGDRLTVAIERTTEAEAAKRFPAEWNYFKNYQGTPTSGTPLHELPGISQSMIAMLVLNGIRSIEDLVAIPAEVANTIGLDAMTARNIAVQWHARKSGASKTIELADQAGRAEMELTQALARNRELEKLAATQDATINALKSIQGSVQQAVSNPGMVDATPLRQQDYGESNELPDIFGSPTTVAGNSDLNLNLDDDVDPLKG